jgi:ribosomal protein S18 acetylase RimI-like enzyme
MNEIIETQAVHTSGPMALPLTRVEIVVRVGTMDDLPNVDRLMKLNSKALAFLPTQALEGKIRLKEVLVAHTTTGEFAGYLIGNDRYKSRDELGVIYQLCVEKKFRRMFVGAHLLKARFESSAWGTKLYCCWCAQDLVEANRFYESMGFVPIAYRAGSTKKKRVHIFWQKRIREGDVTTPWWFPSETRGGLMDAARIALPIMPGVKWSDELPVLELPALPVMEEIEEEEEEEEVAPPPPRRNPGGFYFGPPEPVKKPKPKKIKKVNPELASKARELRDKYLEQFNAMPPALSNGKYEVARQIESSTINGMNPQMLIAA